MVVVEITETETGVIQALMVQGHAGKAPHGEDLVCAAVSVLVQTAILGLTEMVDQNLKYEIRPGYVALELPREMDRGAGERARVILQTIVRGLEATAESYGDYVTINHRFL